MGALSLTNRERISITDNYCLINNIFRADRFILFYVILFYLIIKNKTKEKRQLPVT